MIKFMRFLYWRTVRSFSLTVTACAILLPQIVRGNGDLDSAFVPAALASPPGVQCIVWDILPFSDETMLVAGNFKSSATIPTSGFVKLTSTGSVDPTFANGLSGVTGTAVTCMKRQLDGKILVAGAFAKVHNVNRNRIARIHADGTLDTTFDPGAGGNGNISSLAIQPDGKVIVGGDFTSWNGIARVGVVRLDVDGSLDSSFGNLGSIVNFAPGEKVRTVALQPVSSAPHFGILVAGIFYRSADGGLHSGVIRLNANGTRDTTFDALKGAQANSGNNTYAYVACATPQVDGKVLVGGRFPYFNGLSANGIIRLNPNGTTDTTFRTNMGSGLTSGSIEGHEFLMQPDGKIVVVGAFTHASGSARQDVARYNSDGTLDAGFTPATHTDNGVVGLAMDPHGKLLIGGDNPASISLPLRRLNSGLATGFGSVQFATTTETVTEGNDVTLTVNRTGANSGAASVNYLAYAVSAVPGVDLPATSGTLAWADGDMEAKTILIQVPTDSMLEPVESFLVSLGVPLGAVRIGEQATAAITVQDGDTGSTEPTVSFPLATSSAIEGAAVTATITANLSIASATQVTVPFTLSGTATAGTGKDYTLAPASPLVFAPGSTSASITVTLVDDLVPEGNETIVVTLGVPTGAVLDTIHGTHTLTINDNETKPSFTTPVESRVVALNAANVSFTASAEGLPTPKVDWLYNNRVISGFTNAPGVAIVSAQLSNAGTYAAKATNKHGSLISTATLVVVDTREKNIFCALGANAVLPVTLAGKGSTFAWSNAGGPLSGARYLNTGTKTLTIKTTVLGDYGEYTCRVSGPGEDFQDVVFRLKVVDAKPVFNTTLIDLGTKVVSEPVNLSIKETMNLGVDDRQFPSSFSAISLPAGLKLDPVSGVISGNPTTVSKTTGFAFTIKATNPKGTTSVPGKLVVTALPGGLAGNYNTIVAREATLNKLGGRISFDVLANGTLSGKCYLGAATHSFKGVLNTSSTTPTLATASISIPRVKASTLTFTFTFNSATGYLTAGSLVDGSINTPVTGWRNQWNPAPAVKPFAGYYTVAFNPPMPVDPAVPQGNGYVTFTVAATGTLTATGKTGDNATISSAGTVGPGGELILFSSLYTGKGAIHGQADIEQGVAADFSDNTLSGTDINWTRESFADRAYGAGFTDVKLTAVGGRYVPPAAGSIVMGCDDVDNNATLLFVEGGVPTGNPGNPPASPNVTLRIKVGGSDVVQTVPNPRATAVTISPATGLFNGSFSIKDTNPVNNKAESRPALFYGVIVRHDGGTSGCGHFLLQEFSTPGVTTTATSKKLSGQVRLEKTN